ncbi:hypothetical protein [Actinomadura rayongensis]|uniref:Uncharacterized protein n=1 Tax=Actinomadura rayongensis TaxID=1429076 RepID=A0A6I4WA59_9ACTN|nr:hypothetical protein [Actinomadura rayongensis]MXQ67739.1 hypothetical protein [Actinomadura rayongensis]
MSDVRTYIRLHDGMPDHPKIEALSDRAFRLLITCWCWCSRHLTDGHIPGATWAKRGTPRARAELLAAGLVEQTRDGVRMHDYLRHQRSAAEVDQLRQARGETGSLGNHIRWHVRQGVRLAGCVHCHPERSHPPNSPAGQSRKGKVDPRQRVSRRPDADTLSPGDNSVDNSPTSNDAADSVAGSVANRSQTRSQTDRESSPETETEVLRGSVDRHPADRCARTRAREEEPHPLGPAVAAELRALTGRQVSADHASGVARLILRGRQVSDPRAYVAAALRADPAAFLPTEGDPSRRSLTEALTDAMPSHPCPHGATGPERCPMCRRARPSPPGGPSATSISDKASSTRTSAPSDGPPDSQVTSPPDPDDLSAQPGPGPEGEPR